MAKEYTDYFPTDIERTSYDTSQVEDFNPKTDGYDSLQSIPPSNIPDQNENIKPKKENANLGRVYNDLSLNFKSIFDNNLFPDDFLILNDIVLSDIPTTAITLANENGVFITETLRSKNAIVVPNNAQNISLSLSLAFDTSNDHLNKLHRLLSVIQVHPLTYIYNNKIRKSLSIPSDQSTIFILEHGNLRNSTEVIGGYLLDLQFNYFNYKPFSNHFWYNASLPGNQSARGKFNQEVANSYNNNSITDLTGYAASDYKINQATDKLYSQIKKEGYRFGLGKSPLLNQPVPFPGASETWMYLADHLSKENNTTNINSGYIGFGLREYQQFTPPSSDQRVGQGNANAVFNKKGFPKVNDFYKAKEREQEEILSKSATERKIEVVTGENTNKEEVKKIKIAGTNKDGKWNETIVDIDSPSFIHILKEVTTRPKDIKKFELKGKNINEFQFNPNVRLIFQDVASLFPKKKIIIVRAIGPGNGPHGKGIAIDLKVQGIDNKQLFTALYNNGWGNKFGGLEYLPNSTFVHVDVRGIADYPGHNHATVVVDLSGPGEKANYVKNATEWLKNNGLINTTRIPRDESTYTDKKYFNSYAELSTGKSDPKRYEEDKQSLNKRNINSRVQWIVDMKKKGWNYYWEDRTLKNIFYRDHKLDISHNNNPEALQNIVCSNISLNFGHRIVPQRLLTQDTCTYQFLGPGNKSGTMVFTFAGEAGKRSADSLKSIFSLARKNNMIFQSLIPNSGSISLDTLDSQTGRRNNILELLKFKNIVISDTQESSVPGMQDQYQLVVNFIFQEFSKEQLEKRFITTLDSKKKIISKVMEFLWVDRQISHVQDIDGVRYEWDFEKIGGIKDNVHIKPNSKIKDKPQWFKDIITKAGKICNKLNTEMPPSLWKVNTVSSETWKDRYAQFGAQEVMFGQVKNIEIRERNAKPDAFNTLSGSPYNPNGNYLGTFDKDLTTIDKAIEENKKMYENRFVYNGGKYTNKVHEDVYDRWTNQMSLIADEIKKYMMSDKENFDAIFGGLSKELLASVANGITGCYSDLDMPSVPGGTLPLPPEFYVFNDSDENPAIMNITDDSNMNIFLQKHIENERRSIKHFLEDTYLGGSYLSRNMPKILRERASYMQQFKNLEAEATGKIGEYDFFNAENMMTEGTKIWDPLFYIFDDKRYPSTSSKSHEGDLFDWRKNLSEQLSISNIAGEEGTRTKFMDNIIALSPYLKHGHGKLWNSENDDVQETIEAIYDEDWRKLTFGPNPNYITVDEKLLGTPSSKKEKDKRDKFSKSQSELKAKKDNENIDNIDNKNRKQLKDGAVVSIDDMEIAAINIQNNITKGDVDQKQAFVEKYLKEKYKTTRQKASSIAIREALNAYDINKNKSTIRDARKIGNTYKSGVKAVGNIFLPQVSKLIDIVEDEIDNADNANKQKITSSIAGELPTHTAIDAKFTQENNNINLAKMCKGIAFGQKAADLSIRRIYPTFKIFFIEEDSHETEKIDGEVFRAWDDFYSYSCIQEIKITRSRKIASDLAIIRMTNVGGKLLRKKYGSKDPLSIDGDSGIKYGVQAEYSTGILSETEFENPYEKLILQDGVKTQIRLGADDNADNLETVFLGQIVEIAPSNDGKIIEIMCQGYGAELESVELGPYEDGPIFYSTQQVLSGAIIQDSIVNFGRRGKYNRFTKSNYGESRHAFTGGLGQGIAATAINNLITKWSDEKLYRFFYHYQFLNYPQDDNIYAPPPHVYTTTWMRFWDNACIYRPLNQTPWEIFKEHELRHPGYVSLAIPYGHSPRMTMFFGAKGQHYWAAPPTNKEIFFSETIADNILVGRGLSSSELKKNPLLIQQIKKLAGDNPELARAILTDLAHDAAPLTSARAIGEIFGRYKPFRNYHYYDSNHHILKNNIKTSKDGVFNEIEILYFGDENQIKESSSEDLAGNIEELARKEANVLSSKLDENLPEEHIRSYTKAFPSCITKDMAKRYIQGLFGRYLRDAYKGELVILGDPTVKPYSICYINDMSINMTGPIEVESVTHIFNREQGFISVITPDLCVDINEFYSATIFDVAGAAFANLYSLDNPNASSILAGTPIGYSSYLGLCAATKLLQWTQGNGDPVVITPLTLQGKPFTSVAVGGKNASLFTTWGGQWNQMWDDIQQGWKRFDFTEELMDTGRTWQEKLYTLFSSGRGAGYSIEKVK